MVITLGNVKKTTISSGGYLFPLISVQNVTQTPTLISGNTYYYAFTQTSVTNTITFTQATTCSVLVVGGGGGGGGANYGLASAAGGGGIIYATNVTIQPGTYTIVVGKGGSGGVGDTVAPQNGDNSSAFGAIAYGGGGGVNHS